jgi:predicted nucleic acid-binding protein
LAVLIDSWAWIEYWKGGRVAKRAAGYIEGEEEAVVSAMNLAGIYSPVEKAIAIEAAKIKRKEKLGLADSMILATARQAGGRVITGDPDMKGLEDVVFLAGPRQ